MEHAKQLFLTFHELQDKEILLGLSLFIKDTFPISNKRQMTQQGRKFCGCWKDEEISAYSYITAGHVQLLRQRLSCIPIHCTTIPSARRWIAAAMEEDKTFGERESECKTSPWQVYVNAYYAWWHEKQLTDCCQPTFPNFPFFLIKSFVTSRHWLIGFERSRFWMALQSLLPAHHMLHFWLPSTDRNNVTALLKP